MKKFFFVTVFLILGFNFNAQASETWLCEADCGGVTMQLSFVYEGLVPIYIGGSLFGEGDSLSAAYSDLKNKCRHHIHKGFSVYSPPYQIVLNKRFSVTDICRKI